MDKIIRRIMVHIDGTEESITASQYAVCLARAMNAELYAIYVVNTRALADLVKTHIFLKEEEEEYSRDLAADAERYLNHVRNLARQKGLAIETLNLSGTVHQVIKEKVDELAIDLLVIPEQPKVRSRRDELYNESERAMRHVSCSVLVARNEDRIYETYQALV